MSDDFYWGVVTSLLTLHQHEESVVAADVVNSVGGLGSIEAVIKKHGGECELELLDWLKLEPRVAH